MSFEASIRTDAGIVVLDLHGDIDGAADAGLNGIYGEAIDLAPTRVLLNFSDVSYINSTGIALIVGLLAEARGSGRTVLACGLTDHYKDIFEITRIADFMTIFADESSALAAGTSA
jgi:anti-sigma B factor antagonist